MPSNYLVVLAKEMSNGFNVNMYKGMYNATKNMKHEATNSLLKSSTSTFITRTYRLLLDVHTQSALFRHLVVRCQTYHNG